MRRDRERYATGWAWSDRLFVRWFRWRSDRAERRLRQTLRRVVEEGRDERA